MIMLSFYLNFISKIESYDNFFISLNNNLFLQFHLVKSN